MYTNGPHLKFVNLLSFLLPEPKVYTFTTPEASQIHHHLSGHLPVTGIFKVEADATSLRILRYSHNKKLTLILEISKTILTVSHNIHKLA